jgi:hypothetical protein
MIDTREPNIPIIDGAPYLDSDGLRQFVKANHFLVQFARLFEISYTEEVNTPRTKALRRLCKSQLTEVRHSLAALLDDDDTD